MLLQSEEKDFPELCEQMKDQLDSVFNIYTIFVRGSDKQVEIICDMFKGSKKLKMSFIHLFCLISSGRKHSLDERLQLLTRLIFEKEISAVPRTPFFIEDYVTNGGGELIISYAGIFLETLCCLCDEDIMILMCRRYLKPSFKNMIEHSIMTKKTINAILSP